MSNNFKGFVIALGGLIFICVWVGLIIWLYQNPRPQGPPVNELAQAIKGVSVAIVTGSIIRAIFNK